MSIPTRKEIISTVAAVWGRPIPAITGTSRLLINIEPRQVAAWIMVEQCGYASAEAGRSLCRDRTTMINSRQVISARLEQGDGLLREKIDRVMAELGRPEWERSEPPVPKKPDRPIVRVPEIDEDSEVLRLRRLGWSLRAICHRTSLPERKVAKMIGVELMEAAE